MINANGEQFRAFLLHQFDVYADRFEIPLGHKIFGPFDNSLINPLRFTLLFIRYMYINSVSNPNVSV